MMNCRGMGAVTKKGNKPIVLAKGKKVPGKVKGYAAGNEARPEIDYEAMGFRSAPRGMRDSISGGRRMAKGKTVKRKMKGKSC